MMRTTMMCLTLALAGCGLARADGGVTLARIYGDDPGLFVPKFDASANNADVWSDRNIAKPTSRPWSSDVQSRRGSYASSGAAATAPVKAERTARVGKLAAPLLAVTLIQNTTPVGKSNTGR